MAPGKVNYKTYEAQARLVRAIVAAHPEQKWNYKEICKCYGSDLSEHALNHRFRRLRAQSVLIQEASKRNLDMKDLTHDENALPATQGDIDVANIAKYFGASTGDGIQFQFRSIKKDADKLRLTASQGGDVAKSINLGLGPASPAATPTKSGGVQKRGRKSVAKKAPVKHEESDGDSDDQTSVSYADETDQDESPAKRGKINPVKREGQISIPLHGIAAAPGSASLFGPGQPHPGYLNSNQVSHHGEQEEDADADEGDDDMEGEI